MLAEIDFHQAATLIGCEVAVIKAVDAVESGGTGFLKDGSVVILFEPHVFWKELLKRTINPKDHTAGNEDILYPVWGTKPYGPASGQWARLNRAIQIHHEAALCSASWGRFQIMGFNYSVCGCKSIDEFVTKMKSGEGEHLQLFVQYIKSEGLDVELEHKDWNGFARAYNGAAYKKNNYDLKLEDAYCKLKMK